MHVRLAAIAVVVAAAPAHAQIPEKATSSSSIRAADNYVTVHAAGREYLLRETLATLERQLDPSRFVRISRSTIAALDRIIELHPSTHGDFDVRLRDGTELTLSRSWREHVERALGRPL